MKRLIIRSLTFSILLGFAVLIQPGVFAQGDGRIVTNQVEAKNLQTALEKANDGDIIEIYGGLHRGPILIDKSVSLVGHDWPIIDGGGGGTTIKIVAPDVSIQGFTVRNSGDSLAEENSGIAVEAPRALLTGNQLDNTLFGIYLKESDNTVIQNNRISGMDLPVPRRGDPIRVWFSKDVVIQDNTVNKGRDVVLWYSERITVRENTVSEGRYGLHFMYCDDATIENNLLTNNSVGTFLMYSRRLHLSHNTISNNRGPSGFGIGLKDMDDAVVEDNLFLDNRIGAHVDNSPREVNSIGQFTGNVFAYNDIGVNLMPSVRNNEFMGNSFVDNEIQVGIAGGGGRPENNTWTVGKQGNYWSDYIGYDSDGDTIGDVPYKAERLFENMIDHNSSLRLFLYSPVEQAIDFAARAVPLVKPKPKLVDEAPMMKPVYPSGLPQPPHQSSQPMWLVSSALILLAAFLLVWGFVQKKFSRSGSISWANLGDKLREADNKV